MSDESTGSAYSPELRRRAEQLTDLSCRIEQALVTAIDASLVDVQWASPRGRLCEQLLRRNLHQLHRAADDLRVTAMRFRERADELDAAWGLAA